MEVPFGALQEAQVRLWGLLWVLQSPGVPGSSLSLQTSSLVNPGYFHEAPTLSCSDIEVQPTLKVNILARCGF